MRVIQIVRGVRGVRVVQESVIVPAVVLLGMLAGCNSVAPEQTGSPPSARPGLNAAGVDDIGVVESYPLPDCTGQSPSVCSYDGFDPEVDGFSFANWSAEGGLGATELIALFGKRACHNLGSGSGSSINQNHKL